MNAAVEIWIAYAREDLEVARHAVSVGWLKPACFHAQQCGEKWLKALLTYHGQPPPRSHNLDYLADLLEAFAKNVAGSYSGVNGIRRVIQVSPSFGD